jgi:hypothetical protein
LGMSALPPKADKQRAPPNVRLVPGADSCIAAIYGLQCSLNPIVGEREQSSRDVESESLGGFEVESDMWRDARAAPRRRYDSPLQRDNPARSTHQSPLSGGAKARMLICTAHEHYLPDGCLSGGMVGTSGNFAKSFGFSRKTCG